MRAGGQKTTRAKGKTARSGSTSVHNTVVTLTAHVDTARDESRPQPQSHPALCPHASLNASRCPLTPQPSASPFPARCARVATTDIRTCDNSLSVAKTADR